MPLRNRVFGNVASPGRWGSRLAPVSNWMSRSRLMRWLNEKLLGIDRRRRPPTFVRQTLRRQSASLAEKGDAALCPKRAASPFRALLFPDTFTNYYEPEIGMAAVRLLHGGRCSVDTRAGNAALLRPAADFQRPAVEAVDLRARNVASLYPWAAAGTPIVACEPSCILTIKDDYPALLRGEERQQAETVAGLCVTFEELLDRLLTEKPAPFRAGPKRVLVQGHCHQRSLVGMAAALRLLRRIPGAEVVDLDAGCCGMAGSFGYEEEHYEVSRLVGEQRLFPAVRGADPADVVVAPGLSCRMQIAHFTDRRALHPAELLASLLDNGEPTA